ncbi:MAG: PIN domain-containing protein [Flavobacteriales bacterium]|nr:PIN domain-containing protein [Flavobacteriales bacterium]
MRQIFVDTNIVIDLFSEREPFYTSAADLFSLADKEKITLHISALSVANIHYILSRQKKGQEVSAILRKLRVLLKLLPLDSKIIDLSLSDELFTDYEDGIQYYTAIENNMECIITRNKKDFKNAQIPVFTAEEFVSQES